MDPWPLSQTSDETDGKVADGTGVGDASQMVADGIDGSGQTGSGSGTAARGGYGFVQPDGGGKDVFLHISALERALREGNAFDFRPTDSPNSRPDVGREHALRTMLTMREGDVDLDDWFDFKDLGDHVPDNPEGPWDAILHEGQFRFLCDGDDGEIGFDDPGLVDDPIYVEDVGADPALTGLLDNDAPQNILALFR